MRRACMITLVVLALASGLVAGQCSCSDSVLGEAPPCYTTFRLGQEVRFKLVVPLDYFMCCPASDTPLITRWRVETMDGVIIYEEALRAAKGHWYEISWDQRDSCRQRIAGGYYRIAIQTTSGEFFNYIQVGATHWGWCDPCCVCRCCECPCPIPLCKPYVKFLPSHQQSWSPCGCTFSVTLRMGSDCSIDCCDP